MNIRTIARTLFNALEQHQPLVEVGISRDNLLHNLHTYQSQYPDLLFAPVLKSNAYGHGLTVVAELLDSEKIAFFVVDSYFEARTLRRAGIHSRILIMGYVAPEEIARNELIETDYAIVSLEQLRVLAKAAYSPIRLHFKIDTGMHRQGIIPTELPEAIKLLKSTTHLQVVGACSHFADADNTDQTRTMQQVEVWNTALQELTHAFPTIQYRHIAATKGAKMSAAAGATVARLGIGLYGFDTSPEGDTLLKPVLEMRTKISSVRHVPTGDFVGYNATYTAPHPVRIASVPVGYFEGVDRRLSNKGCMLVNGTPCPIVGRVSMNMSSIDVSAVPEAKAGDAVVVISRNSKDPNSVQHIVKAIHTPEYSDTEYVILVHIPQHLKRVVE